MGEPWEARFWSKVEQRDPSECWPWAGKPNTSGYGMLRVGAKMRLAHRVAYELLVGPIPPGMTVDHECHNRDRSCRGGKRCPHRLCVNPAHLVLRTRIDNAVRGQRDRLRAKPQESLPPLLAGRVHGSETHCPRGHPYDEQNTYCWSGSGRRYRMCRRCHRERERERRRLEREGLAVLGADGLWRTTLPVHECEFVAGRCSCGMPADPFDGLPR